MEYTCVSDAAIKSGAFRLLPELVSFNYSGGPLTVVWQPSTDDIDGDGKQTLSTSSMPTVERLERFAQQANNNPSVSLPCDLITEGKSGDSTDTA